jgi:hypothetical protein
MALGGWWPKRGRPNQRPAVDLWLSDPCSSARSEYYLDAATKRRHGGTFSTRRGRSGLAVERRWPYLASDASGLPQHGCFFTVFRQAMAGDEPDPAGIYFGTNSGSVFASLDEGENWQEIARHNVILWRFSDLQRSPI